MDKLAQKAAEEGDSVLDYLKVCRGALLSQLAALNVAGDSRNVAYVVGQLTRTLETMARISGELGDMAHTINVTNNVAVLQESPAFARVQAAILRALQPHAEARLAVVRALRTMDDGDAQAATPSPVNGKLIDLQVTHHAG
jgi:hypothetical protein